MLLDNAFLEHDFLDFYLGIGKENGLSFKQISPVINNCLNLLDESKSVDFKSVVEFVNQLLHVNNCNNLASLFQ